MKRFKLGFGIVAVAGTLLFGMTTHPTEASAEQPDRLAPTPGNPVAAKAQDVIHASLGAKPSVTPMALPESGICPRGMVDVQGDYCPYLEQKCLRWLDPETQQRCAEFAPAAKCEGKTLHKHFCIDEFEYPNLPGEKPAVMTTWYEAQSTCEKEGKRLCGDSEWTLACEGQERLPYPYGYARNAEACNIDKPHPDVNEAAFADPARRFEEAARLDQRDPSGAREACVSPYGVHDLTGNVDEWVVNESGHPYKSGLKGGYWGPVRDRCRPMTIAHNEGFSFYQIGFRCCSDAQPNVAKAGAGKPGAPAEHVGAPAPVAGAQGTMLAGS
jgi:sulfatase modifying factor 1